MAPQPSSAESSLSSDNSDLQQALPFGADAAMLATALLVHPVLRRVPLEHPT